MMADRIMRIHMILTGLTSENYRNELGKAGELLDSCLGKTDADFARCRCVYIEESKEEQTGDTEIFEAVCKWMAMWKCEERTCMVDRVKVQAYQEPETCGRCLAEYLKEYPADYILFAGTAEGIQLGKCTAGILGVQCLPDVQKFTFQEALYIKRKVYSAHMEGLFPVLPGRNIVIGTANGKTEKQWAEANIHEIQSGMEIRELEWQFGRLEKVLGKEEKETACDLAKADLVLIGGRGLKTKENYQRLKALAKRLGAACGCTRPVAISGWDTYSSVVGISGSCLNADTAVTFGVSGAAPMIYGTENVQRLIAINTDEEAPVFSYAQEGIVADCVEIIKEMELYLEQKQI